MHIVHLAAELSPFAKVGGLADVCQGLYKELIQQGQKVTFLLPKYACIQWDGKVEKLYPFSSFFAGRWQKNQAWILPWEGGKLCLLEPLSLPLFQGPGIYEFSSALSEIEHFLYFSRSALDFLCQSPFLPKVDVFHVHDWHTAICPYLIQTWFIDSPLAKKKSLLTIHNLFYQGSCLPSQLQLTGITPNHLLPKEEKYSLLKIGIESADWITTVSPTYAKEILSPEQGMGLERSLNHQKQKLCGILNGLDAEDWNPKTDTSIAFPFSADQPIEVVVAQKKNNKKMLQQELQLSIENKPFLILVSRLVEQKGLDLMEKAIEAFVALGGQVLLIGSGACPQWKKRFERLKKHLPPHQAYFHFAFDEPLSRKAYAASDFILIPSRFEPCGLTQLIAMRYGSIPIVRKTGGLADTVFDVEDTKVGSSHRNGYVFSNYEEQEMIATLKRAFFTFTSQKEKHNTLMEKALSYPSSWRIPAQSYLHLYQKLLS